MLFLSNTTIYIYINIQIFRVLSQITELISTCVVLHLANIENLVTPRKTLCIVGIAVLHIIASGFDQFIANVFKGEGFLHQVLKLFSLYNNIDSFLEISFRSYYYCFINCVDVVIIDIASEAVTVITYEQFQNKLIAYI